MFFLILTSILWSVALVLAKKHLAGVDQSFLSFLCFAISALIFLPFVGGHIKGRYKWRMFKLGLIQFGLMSIFYSWALRFLEPHQVILASLATPFYLLIFNFFFEFKPRPLSLTLVVLNILISIWIGYKDGFGSIWGVLLVQLSSLCFAYGQIFYKSMRNRIEGDDREIFFWPYLAATLLTGINFLIFGNFSKLSMTGPQWGVVAYLGVIASALGYLFWNKGTTKTGVGNLAISNNIKIPLVLIASLFFLGERVEWIKLLIYFTLFFGSTALMKGDQEKFL